MSIKNFINFYKDCYESDTRTVSLGNFFSTKVENRFFLEGKDELLNGHLPRVPIDKTVAEEVLENLTLYSKEKSLYVFAFFTLGKAISSKNKTTNICAPLFFFPAQIQEDDGLFYLSINHNLAFPNITFLESYRKDNTLEISELFENVLNGTMSFEKCGLLRRKLEDSFYQFNAERLLMYPESITEKSVKALQKKSTENLTVVPAIAMGVIKHSTSTLGIISELKEMYQQNDFSSAIQALFDYNKAEVPGNFNGTTYVPIILSKPQKQAIDCVNKYQETMIVGPPGTGKSFTIAALAVDQVNKGKSVLIVSKTNQAVDVVQHKIEEEIGIKEVVVRGGRKQYLKDLKHKIRTILGGVPAKHALKDAEATHLREKIKLDKLKLEKLEELLFDQITDDLEWGTYLYEERESENIFSLIKKKYLEWLNSKQVPHWNIILDYYALKEEHLNDLKQFVDATFQYQLWSTLLHYRKLLRNFRQALSARTLSKQEELFNSINFNIIFKAFPVWMCTFSDLFEVLPHKKELFDLVIIDEASQCDIASCLPAIQRAKKVVIVGDPMQLRHYSFLSRRFISILRDKHNLGDHAIDQYFDYRDTSILDVYFEKISNQDQIVFLDEHFRGNASLIEFSNSQFYQGKLKVMKSLPHSKHNAVKIIEVDGVKDKSGINHREVEEVIITLKRILDKQKDLLPDITTTIGVLSPFRSQIEHLEIEIQNNFTLEQIERHKIKTGTPYSFQGDERDTMLISWSIDNDTHATALNYLNTLEVFNVAVTRAKFDQHLFTSFKLKNINSNSLLAKYLIKINTTTSHDNLPSKEIHDDFIQEVKLLFTKNAKEIHVAYTVAGILIDILIQTDVGYYGIDLIGYPGKFFDANSMEEYEILGRTGVTMIPLPYSNWYYAREKSEKDLRRIILNEN